MSVVSPVQIVDLVFDLVSELRATRPESPTILSHQYHAGLRAPRMTCYSQMTLVICCLS